MSNFKPLVQKLSDYLKDDFLPMHMPGSKRKSFSFDFPDPYKADITEIPGFDNLHDASGVLKAEMDRAADIFRADESLFLINGSSAGILSAICATVSAGEKIIAAANCHVSVWNGIELARAIPVIVEAEAVKGDRAEFPGAVSPDEVKKALSSDSDIKACIITSPTYEGVVSDIKQIADICHKAGVILIVDEAHGAHFTFDASFPPSANELGADLVINSLHKTLPALTQTGLLHINGSLADKEKVKHYWNIFQTTSPSYILMASISACLNFLQKDGNEAFFSYVKNLKAFREKINSLENIRLFKNDDISKILLIPVDGLRGIKEFGGYLYFALLNDFKIQLEMYQPSYCLAMSTVGDGRADLKRLFDALEIIDNKLSLKNISYINKATSKYIKSDENIKSKAERYVDISMAEGARSLNAICVYPPGVPLVRAGKELKSSDIEKIKDALKAGLKVTGLKDGQVVSI